MGSIPRYGALEVDTLTIDPTGAQFHDLLHSRWTHLQLTPQGSRSTTLEVDTLTIDPTGLTIYNARNGHTYN